MPAFYLILINCNVHGLCLLSNEVVYRMDLSVESCKYRLCQIDKTVKIFDNVAFSGSHFLKIYIYCKLETYLFLDIVRTSYRLCQSFIISLNIGQKTRY